MFTKSRVVQYAAHGLDGKILVCQVNYSNSVTKISYVWSLYFKKNVAPTV